MQETFEKTLSLTEIYEKLEQAQNDKSEGKLLDSEKVFAKLRRKHEQQ